MKIIFIIIIKEKEKKSSLKNKKTLKTLLLFTSVFHL